MVFTDRRSANKPVAKQENRIKAIFPVFVRRHRTSDLAQAVPATHLRRFALICGLNRRFGPRQPLWDHFRPKNGLQMPFAADFFAKIGLRDGFLRTRLYAPSPFLHKADLARAHIMNVRSYSHAGQPTATRPRAPPSVAGIRIRPLPFPHKADLVRRTRHYAERIVPHKADLAQISRIAFPFLSPCRPIGYTIDNTPAPPYPKPIQTNRPILHKADLKSVE